MGVFPNIVREYFQHIFLGELYKLPDAEKLLFKGGTALRIIYGSPRFSEDLDFSLFGLSHHEVKSFVEGLFIKILAEIEKSLGRQALNNMHIHLAGINYTIKGERNHLNLKDSDLNYKDLIRSFKEFKIKGVVISESPNIESDALVLKELLNK